MQRWDILNHLIKKNNYTSYLELGVYKFWCFDRVDCKNKVCVDPNPSRDYWMEQVEYGGGFTLVDEQNRVHVCQKSTTDEFFSTLGEHTKFDIIFIDALHESSQVDRDIQNALKHLSPRGTIVMHDCNPSSYEMTTTGTANGEWCGDVYKSFIKVYSSHLCECYVVDADYGVGVIKPQAFEIGPLLEHLPKVQYGDEGYEEFSQHRKTYLNLISPEEFLAKEKVNQ